MNVKKFIVFGGSGFSEISTDYWPEIVFGQNASSEWVTTYRLRTLAALRLH
jgi:hypothetical protein